MGLERGQLFQRGQYGKWALLQVEQLPFGRSKGEIGVSTVSFLGLLDLPAHHGLSLTFGQRMGKDPGSVVAERVSRQQVTGRGPEHMNIASTFSMSIDIS